MRYLVDLSFGGLSTNANKKAGLVESNCNYDAVCNLKKRQQADWTGFTTGLSFLVRQFIDKDQSLDEELKEGVFILDDSAYKRNFSKNTERVSKQLDHVDMSYYYGFRWSHLGYFSDGLYFPVNSVPVSVSGQDPQKHLTPARPAKTEEASKKRKLTTSKLTEVALKQVDLALKAGFRTRYVLQDS